jgi:uncharacterized damage-inducible protein DinB
MERLGRPKRAQPTRTTSIEEDARSRYDRLVVDRSAIGKLFTFTDYSWDEHESVIRPLGDNALTAPAPGSGWPALRDALAHINWAYIRWLANPDATTDEPVERVASWRELDAYRRRVRDHARGYLHSLDDEELATPREMNVDGETLLYSPGEILVHVLLHERQHHGDVNTLLYQLGIEIPIVEYRFSLPERRS